MRTPATIRPSLLAAALVASALATAVAAGSPQAATARTWIGRHEELEAYLKVAPVVRLTKIGIGVTNPDRAWLEPGGPVESMTWKPSVSGENYKSEIAAYELDKLLRLNMVPVTVEREITGTLGAAVMWVTSTVSFDQFGAMPTPPAAHARTWECQLVRAMMFKNLIYDADRNRANWLVDPWWNLILVDHNRAFSPLKVLAYKMTAFDRDLWEKMQPLDERKLQSVLGHLLSPSEIGLILDRRELMQPSIDSLVQSRAEHVCSARVAGSR